MSDRLGTGILSASHNHPRLNGSGIFGFSTRSWLQTHAYMCTRSICWYHAPEVEGFILPPPPPPRWVLKRFHRFSAVLACRCFCFFVCLFCSVRSVLFCFPRSMHKNLSQPKTTSAEGINFLQHQVDLVLWSLPFLIRRATSVPLEKGTTFALHHGKMSTTKRRALQILHLSMFQLTLLLLNVDITILYPNTQKLTVYM